MPTTARRPAGPRPSTAANVSVDVSTIRATIDLALVRGPSPRYAELVDLERLLHGHIILLLPLAESASDGQWSGSPDAYDRRSWTREVRGHLRHGLGDGLLSAVAQVRRLARDCEVLLTYVKAET